MTILCCFFFAIFIQFAGFNSNLLNTQCPRMKIVEFANSLDPDEMAHNEPLHLNLHCLPSSLINIIQLEQNICWQFG